MSDLPSRGAATSWLHDPDRAVAPSLVFDIVEARASGRLVDREAIDPDRVRAAINLHVHSASEFYDGGAWIETWADIEAAWADIEAALAEEI